MKSPIFIRRPRAYDSGPPFRFGDFREAAAIRLPLNAAFTLIELSVSLAILGILIGLSIPAIKYLRSSTDMAGCTNNLRQIGLIVHNAAMDNDGRIPAIRSDGVVVINSEGKKTSSDKQAPTLVEFIEANGGTADLLVCPAAKRRHHTSTPNYLWVGGLFGPVTDSKAPLVWEFTTDRKVHHRYEGAPAMNVLYPDGSVEPSSYPEREEKR